MNFEWFLFVKSWTERQLSRKFPSKFHMRQLLLMQMLWKAIYGKMIKGRQLVFNIFPNAVENSLEIITKIHAYGFWTVIWAEVAAMGMDMNQCFALILMIYLHQLRNLVWKSKISDYQGNSVLFHFRKTNSHRSEMYETKWNIWSNETHTKFLRISAIESVDLPLNKLRMRCVHYLYSTLCLFSWCISLKD